MTYQQTLDWMFAQLPMYQQKGRSAYNGKLDNIKLFASHLNHPEKKFKSIHVAGTNGKGSSSHMLASILQEAGYKVGLYTSPHLKDYRERIKINGKPIAKTAVIKFIAQNRSFLATHRLSFFEMSVGLAFHFFSEKKVDIAVIEVGLGGRLDSTNIITPEVSLITNIGFDHMDILGDTLNEIALEKAGIIKENIPVVISESQQEIAGTFKAVAESRNARIVFAQESTATIFRTSLLGNYQNRNIKGVIATINQLERFKVSEEQLKSGLLNVVQNTGLLGRWQILQDRPRMVCDTAHNAEGLALVITQLNEQHFDTLHLVLGFVKDKNLDSILPLFPKNAKYYFAKLGISRGLDPGQLEEKAKDFGMHGNSYMSVIDAVNEAKRQAKETDLIFVGGSTFVVAEVV